MISEVYKYMYFEFECAARFRVRDFAAESPCEGPRFGSSNTGHPRGTKRQQRSQIWDLMHYDYM